MTKTEVEKMKILSPHICGFLDYDYNLCEWHFGDRLVSVIIDENGSPLRAFYKKGKIKSKKKKKRKSTWGLSLTEFTELRKSVLERDLNMCVECGSVEGLQIHHKIHRKDKGSHETSNLETLCKRCHAEKHKGEPVHHLMKKALCSGE